MFEPMFKNKDVCRIAVMALASFMFLFMSCHVKKVVKAYLDIPVSEQTNDVKSASFTCYAYEKIGESEMVSLHKEPSKLLAFVAGLLTLILFLIQSWGTKVVQYPFYGVVCPRGPALFLRYRKILL